MAAALTGYKLFRHTSDLAAQDIAWCIANATLIYDGALIVFSDTGLIGSTRYYYKLFAQYDVDGMFFYSNGISADAETQAAPTYQDWLRCPDSPVLSSVYPYQVTGYRTTSPYSRYLWVGTAPFWFNNNTLSSSANFAFYYTSTGTSQTWILNNASTNNYALASGRYLDEANSDVFTDNTYTTVYLAKTTP